MALITGTGSNDNLQGTDEDDVIFSGGVSSHFDRSTGSYEHIYGNGGSDTLVFDTDDTFLEGSGGSGRAHLIIHDFTVGNITESDQADSLDIGAYLRGSNLSAENIGNYLFIVSGTNGGTLINDGVTENDSFIFINKEGNFTDSDKQHLSRDFYSVARDADTGTVYGHGLGTDLMVELRGNETTNNLAELTGEEDNSVEQFQKLIDLGFLDLSNANSSPVDPDTVFELSPLEEGGDINGSSADEIIYSGGVTHNWQGIETKGGSDRLVLDSDDLHSDNGANLFNARIMVRDFRIGNVEENDQADILDIGGFLEGKNLTAENIGDYLHIISDAGYAASAIYVNKEGDFTEQDRDLMNQFENFSSGQTGVTAGADIKIEFYDWAKNSSFENLGFSHETVNFEAITGYADNSVEQFQALIDLGFLDLSGSFVPDDIAGTLEPDDIVGTLGHDDLVGTVNGENIFSNGLSDGVESIRGNGGQDTLIFDADDAHAANNANDSNGHFRIRDFTIEDTSINQDADVLDLGAFLLGSNLDASNIGNYLHVVSGLYGYGTNRSGIFIDREGHFTDEDRAALTSSVEAGGHGADLFLELQGQAANNNLEELTGFKDNTVEQFQALIDMGFLDVSKANSEKPPLPAEDNRIDIMGTASADNIVGTTADENIYSGGISAHDESIRGNGGSDKLIFDADDSFAGSLSLIRVRDFIIDDVKTNDQADVLDIRQFLNGIDLNASNIGNYLHVNSGAWWNARVTYLTINKEGAFTEEDRVAFNNENWRDSDHADVRIEFQPQAANNNFAELTGFADNTVEQFQALIDLGFLDLSGSNTESTDQQESVSIMGTENADNLLGSNQDDIFFSGGLSEGVESIRGNGGSDKLVLAADDVVAYNMADDGHGHFRIRDFVIDDVNSNSEADILDISDLLSGSGISVANLGDHLHIVSGVYGQNRTGVFIDKDGTFSDVERTALDANVGAGGQGADLFLEFQGQAGNNNFAELTGYADNTAEQLQSLIDMGFLDVV